MNAFRCAYYETAASLGALYGGTWLVGFAITRIGSSVAARIAAWTLAIVAVVAAERISYALSGPVRMLALIGALMWSMKVAVTVESQTAGHRRLTFCQWLAFAIAWVGMRPAIFAALPRASLHGAGRLIGRGTLWVTLGVGVSSSARSIALVFDSYFTAAGVNFATAIASLIGLSFLLHFGLFNILAGLWRLAGVDCRPLFRAPLYARTLEQFWGRRWNLAFSEMTALLVYRPVTRICGPAVATLAAFLFSGVLHELAISVPARAGYGLPTLYFALHGLLVLIEREKIPVERWGWPSRAWTLGWLALPLPILFHPPFLHQVIWPILGMEI
jgi:alginate O-acetyltransferase complex protein AlgI